MTFSMNFYFLKMCLFFIYILLVLNKCKSVFEYRKDHKKFTFVLTEINAVFLWYQAARRRQMEDTCWTEWEKQTSHS